MKIIKSIKTYSVLLFILIFMIPCAKAMEVHVESSLAHLQEKKVSQGSKRSRHRINRKKGGKDKESIKSEQSPYPSSAQLESVAELLNLDRINKLLLISDKFQGLSFLANILLFQSWMIKELKAIAFHSKELFETSPKIPICCFSLADQGESLCGHKPGTCDNIVQLVTPAAASLAIDLVVPLWFAENFWVNAHLINDFYYKANEIIGHENKEMRVIGNYVKNAIAGYWLRKRIDSFWDSVLSRLSSMVFNEDDLDIEIDDILLKEGLSNLMAKWLIRNEIYTASQEFLPHFIDLTVLIWELKDYFEELWEENSGAIDLEESFNLYKEINEIILFYEESEEMYQALYKLIASSLANQERCYKQVFLVPTINRLPKDLSVPLLKTNFRDYDNEETEAFAFIIDFISTQAKNSPVKVPPLKKKKRSRHRRNKKKLVVKDEESISGAAEAINDQDLSQSTNNNAADLYKQQEEFIKLPSYAQRVLNWFDAEYIQANSVHADSVLYHTYSPVADFFIQKYGRRCMQLNHTSGFTDTAYYMGGQVRYKNGKTEIVTFGICLGQKECCYHRGFRKHNGCALLPEFVNSNFRYEFPDLSKKLVINKKKAVINNEEMYNGTEYTETEFYIEIYDTANEVTLVLFKPN